MSLTTGLLTGEVDFEEEEAEFDPDADSSSDESADDGGEAPSDHAVLAGAVRLNDEGRVILAGTWSLSSAPDRQVGKFKWKSQASYAPPSALGGGADPGAGGGRALFDVRRPTLARPPLAAGEGGASPPTRRTLIFNGFFIEAAGSKIKERDVEVCFSAGGEGPAHRISGRGSNDYGPFVLDGTYAPPPPAAAAGDGAADGAATATATCRKTYGTGGAAKSTGGAAAAPRRSRRGGGADPDDSADDDFGDEGADQGEVSELCADAKLTVEELRRKYYGGGGGDGDGDAEEGDGGGKAGGPAKRPRLEREEEDDECGF